MIGIDTSFLIALVAAEHELHEQAGAMVSEAVGRGEEMALTPAVVAEFIHAVTDPRRFSKPLTMADALSDAQFDGQPSRCVVCKRHHRPWNFTSSG